jgi:xylose isomerase
LAAESIYETYSSSSPHGSGRLAGFVKQHYSSWDSGIGKKIEQGNADFAELEAYLLKKGEAQANVSGRQEFLKNLINEFI